MCERIAIMHHGKLVALEKTTSLLQRLGTKSIQLKLASPLEKLPQALLDYNAELAEDGMLVRLVLSAGQTSGELLQTCCRLGLDLEEVDTRRAGLEDVFLQMTQHPRIPEEMSS